MRNTMSVTILGVLLLSALSGSAADAGAPMRDWEKQPSGESPFIASTPTNIIADALCAERLAAQRLKWTDDLRRRYDRFLEKAIYMKGNDMAMEYLEILDPTSFPSFEEYIPTPGCLETNCYAIAPLLGNTNEYVRTLVSKYFRRANRVELNRAFKEGALTSADWRKGVAFGPPWLNDVLYPLMVRSMFDRSEDVQLNGMWYCIFPMENWRKLADLARAQGTNEWAMAQWNRLYNNKITNLIPQELFQTVRKTSEAKKEANERMIREAFERRNKVLKELEEKQRNK